MTAAIGPALTPPVMLMRALIGWLLLLGAIGAWYLTLAPTAIGGPATYVLVEGVSMVPTLERGDLVVAHRSDAYRQGDVVVYRVPDGQPGAGALVIHRIVGGDAGHGYVTQGDNRSVPDDWHPIPGDIAGSLWIRLPVAGRYVALLRSPALVASLAAGFTVFLILLLPGPRRRDRSAEATP